MAQVTVASTPKPILVADIGGSNARFACLDDRGQWLGYWQAASADFPDLVAVLEEALDRIPDADLCRSACLAVAAPVNGDEVRLTNGRWTFSRSRVQRHFAWENLLVANDFEAAAQGVTALSPRQYRVIGPVQADSGVEQLPCAVVGPGTGLGVAGLFRQPDCEGDRQWWTLPSEGGHARLAPADAQELAILERLSRHRQAVEREDVLSGPGLCNLYQVMAELGGSPEPRPDDPAEITVRALTDPDSRAAAVLDRFCGWLGSVAADVALDLGCRGVLYLSGGILPQIADFLADSSFRRRFEDHPQSGHYLAAIETRLITEKRLGLMGAARLLGNPVTAPPP